MDDAGSLLAALELHLAWGADEALAETPLDRLRPAAPAREILAEPAARAAASGAEAREIGSAPAGRLPAPPRPAAPPGSNAVALARAAATPQALRAALEQFDGCDLRMSATSLVFADGNPSAGLVVIGEAPGAEEDRTGRAFAGPGGALLDRMLGSIGLDRTQCLLTYVVPWRPPGNRPVSDAELAACLPFLHRHLVLLQPRLLLLLGALPLRALTGERIGIGRARGRLREVTVPGLEQKLPYLAMLHPDQLLAQPAAKRDAWTDLLLLRRTFDGMASRT
jgi:DNA polymerase